MTNSEKETDRHAKNMAKDAAVSWTVFLIIYSVAMGVLVGISVWVGAIKTGPLIIQVVWIGYLAYFALLFISVFPIQSRWLQLDNGFTAVKTLFGRSYQRVGPGLSYIPIFGGYFKVRTTRLSIESVSDTSFSRGGSTSEEGKKIGFHIEGDTLSLRGRNPAMLSGGKLSDSDKEDIDTFDKPMLLGVDFTIYVRVKDALRFRDSFGSDEVKGLEIMAKQLEDRARTLITIEVSKLTPAKVKLKLEKIGKTAHKQLELQVGDPDTAGTTPVVDDVKVPYQGFDIEGVQLKAPIYPKAVMDAIDQATAALERRKQSIADADADRQAQDLRSQGEAAGINNVSAARATEIKRLGAAEKARREDLTSQILESGDAAMAAMIAGQENLRETVKGSNLVAIGGDAMSSTAVTAAIAASTAVKVARDNPQPPKKS